MLSESTHHGNCWPRTWQWDSWHVDSVEGRTTALKVYIPLSLGHRECECPGVGRISSQMRGSDWPIVMQWINHLVSTTLTPGSSTSKSFFFFFFFLQEAWSASGGNCEGDKIFPFTSTQVHGAFVRLHLSTLPPWSLRLLDNSTSPVSENEGEIEPFNQGCWHLCQGRERVPCCMTNPAQGSSLNFENKLTKEVLPPCFLDVETRTQTVSAACSETPIPHSSTWKTLSDLSWFNSRVISFVTLSRVSSLHSVPSADCTWWCWSVYDLSAIRLLLKSKNWVSFSACPMILAESLVWTKCSTNTDKDLKSFRIILVAWALYAVSSVSRLTLLIGNSEKNCHGCLMLFRKTYFIEQKL